MEDALRQAWPSRLTGATGGAALLAVAAADIALFRGLDLPAAVGFGLAILLAFTFVLVRRGVAPRSSFPAIGLAAVVLTQISLVSAVLAPSASGATAPVAVIMITLAVGTLWALLIDLSVEGFAWTAVVSFAILWAPWIATGDEPAAFLLTAGACLALGLRLRSLSAARLFEAYSRGIRVQPAPLDEGLNHRIARMRLSAALGDEDFLYERRPSSPITCVIAKTADLRG